MLSQELKFRASGGNIAQNKVVRKQRHVYCRGIKEREWSVTLRCMTVWNSNKFLDDLKVIFKKSQILLAHSTAEGSMLLILKDILGNMPVLSLLSQLRWLLCLYSKYEVTTSSRLAMPTTETGGRGNRWPGCHMIASPFTSSLIDMLSCLLNLYKTNSLWLVSWLFCFNSPLCA